MRLFLLKAVRDLRAMGLRAIAVLLVVGAGIGTAAGIALALEDIRATRDAFYREQRLADVDVRLRRALPDDELLAHAREAGASVAETRLVAEGTALLPSGDRPAAELVGMSPDARLNRLVVVEGRPLDRADPSGALLEVEFARHAGAEIGDRLRVLVAGRVRTLRVRGMARSPEYLLASASPQYLIPQQGSLAVAFLPRGAIASLLGARGQANDLIADFPPGTSRRRQLALASGLPVARVIPREEQFSVRLTEADVESFATFAPVLGAVFAAIGVLLITLSLRRLVHAQRRELGAMLALGYRARAVVLTVLLPAVILGLGGALLAALVTVAVARLVAVEYSQVVGFPETVHELAAPPLLAAVAGAMAATLLAALAPAYRIARLTPSAAIRGEQRVAFSLPAALERVTALGGPAVAYAARTLLRRPLLTGATVASIAAAVGLGAALNVLATSTNRAIDETLGAQRWSYSADFDSALRIPDARALAARSGARSAEPVAQGPARLISIGGRSAAIELVGLPARPALRRLTLTEGGPPRRGGVVVSEQSASALGAEPGDRLELVAGARRTAVRVAGAARTLAGRESFLPRQEAGPLLGLAGRATGMLVAGPAEVAEALRRDPRVARVTSRAEAEESAHEMIAELTSLIDVLLAISLGVGAVFLASSLALSFLDRQGEFATLRALGYGRWSIARMVGAEALAQTGVAAALSVPVGLAIAWLLAERIGEAWFRIGLDPATSDFTLVIAAALALAVLAGAQAVRRILRLSIARTVRMRLID